MGAVPEPSPFTAQLTRTRVTRHEVDVDGLRTAYWGYGQPDAETTILAVHGFRGDHHGLEPLAAHLDGYRVIAPDLPGYGQTPPVPGVEQNLDAFTGWLRRFGALVAPGAVVLGHSFGSIVSSAAVADGMPTPRLILVNPIGAPALEGPRGVFTRLAVFYYWLGAKLPASIGGALLRMPLITRVMSVTMAKTHERRLRRWIHEEHERFYSGFASRDSVYQGFVTSVSNNVGDVAERIAQPTLLIAAQHDDITPIEKQRELASRFPDAQLVEIADVGHLIHYETPEIAAGTIRRFLSAPDERDPSGR
ncbi:MAG: alpha/beta hydrolase [Microbacterium sp.]